MPRVTLLPTPEPEKIPIRCPSPQVSSPSIARTPAAKTDHFGFDLASREPIDFNHGANGRGQACYRGCQPLCTHDAARHCHRQHRVELWLKRVHYELSNSSAIRASCCSSC